MNIKKSLNVLVLAGGPDKEHEVSLQSGAEVASGLKEAGHDVWVRDIGPGGLEALDEFTQRGGDVIFPALHGPWGEGGGLQEILDSRGIKYVGCRASAARLCIDKQRTKQLFLECGLPTPGYEVLGDDQQLNIKAPLVIKPVCEGSSIDILICKDEQAVRRGRVDLAGRYQKLMYEQFVSGRELTVAVLDAVEGNGGEDGSSGSVGGAGKIGGTGGALPAIEIISQTTFYDYQAKYERNDTQFLFDFDMKEELIKRVQGLAVEAHRILGCRHMSRVDFIVDADGGVWLLEVNTIPGFTSHSLLPKAAKRAGIDWSMLVDRLVRMAAGDQGISAML